MVFSMALSMVVGTETERHEKAMFAFVMITGVRAGAVVSFRLKHINLPDRHVF